MVKALAKRFTLWNDNAGTGAMELALALPVLMMLLVGMIDMSRIIANRIDMEQAAIRATDYALAVRPANGNSTYIRNEAAAAGNVPTSDVAVSIFLECDGVLQSSFNTICASTEDQARFVSVKISRDVETIFDWPKFAAILGWDIGMTSPVTVTGDSIVRFQ